MRGKNPGTMLRNITSWAVDVAPGDSRRSRVMVYVAVAVVLAGT